MAKSTTAIFRYLYIALFTVTLLCAGMAVQAQDQDAASELTGEASVVIFDNFQTGKSELRYYIIDNAKNRETRLFFGANAPTEFKTGKKFKVRGKGHARGLDVQTLTLLEQSGSSSSQDNGSEAPLATNETRNVLTILVDFNDAYVDGAGMNYGISLQEAKDRMFNQAKSVAGLFYNASLGTLTIPDDPDDDGVQDVFGPYQINDSYIGGESNQCSPSTWVNLASAAWEAANPTKDINLYRHRHLIVPNYWDWGNRHCGWGGVAQVGCGTWCWAIGADPVTVFHGVTIHELGHNFGFNHARTDSGNDGYSSSVDSEYGDSSDMMGGSRNWMKFNAPHAEDKGWVDPTNYELRTVVPSASLQSFDLIAMDEEAAEWPGLRALKLPRTSNTDYYVSYRRQAGGYNNVSSSYANRLNIHYGFDNSTYSYYVGTLAAGQSFVDPYNNVTISATSAVQVLSPDEQSSTTVMGVEVCENACSSIVAPSGLAASALSTSAIDLTWNDNSNNEDGFRLEHSLDGSGGSWSQQYQGTDLNYTHNGLATGSTHHYRVQAYNTGDASGWSDVAIGMTLAEPPIAAFTWSADFTELTFTDTSTDDGTVTGWSWDFGDGNGSSAQNPVHTYATGDDYTVQLTATDNHGASDSTSQLVTAEDPPFVDQHSTGSTTQEGTVSGSHTNTHDDDGTVQAITERESNGNPAKRRSSSQHRWTFSVTPGTSMTLTANAWVSGPPDVDGYTFAYSTDASNYTDLFTVSNTDETIVQMAALPANLSGTVYLRVVDTDNSQGERVLGQLSVDHLVIRTDNQPVTPPADPSGLGANAVAHNQVDLAWTDNASDETGYEVDRAPGGTVSWSLLTTLGSNASSYSDTSVSELTSYDYRVRAMKGATPSEYSFTPDSVTTPGAPAGGDIVLSADGRKVKGVHHVDLSWSGNNGNVDVYRDGNPASVASNVSGSGTTDITGAKGGATYNYEVCETGETDAAFCSNTATVVY